MSLPSAIGSMPHARATAPPPLLPPQVFVRSYGFSVAPNTGLNVCEPAPNSGVFVLPTVIAPACLMRSTSSESSAGTKSLKIGDPNVVRMPLVGCRSLCAIGSPCSGPTVAARQPFVGQPRALHRPFGDERDDRVDRRVDARDLLQMRGDHLARGELLRADSPRHLDGAQFADVGDHRSTRQRLRASRWDAPQRAWFSRLARG